MSRLLCLGLVLLVPALVRAEDWPVPRGPSGEPQPYTYQAKTWQKVPRDFLDNAPAVILYTGTSYLLEADGTVDAITHEITRLNGRKGIDNLGEYTSIYYTPAYEKLTLNLARIHKKDGRVVDIEPRHVHLRDTITDFQVYDQDKQLVISFPNLEVGDVYEVKWTVRGKNPEFSGGWFTRYTFGSDDFPAARDEFRVRVPKGMPFKFALNNGKVDQAITDEEGGKLYRFSVDNRPELPQDEEAPSKEELRLQISCSNFASWDDVARWKKQLRAECWKCTAEVRKIVDTVTAGLKTPQEKARALTTWVRRNVRYLSHGTGGTGFTPHLPHQVVGNRYGDCKDQAQLLAVLLREAGIAVELATLGPKGDGQVLPSVPSPWGSHAILCAKIGGKEHWIDTTSPYSSWDFLPADDRDRQCYLTTEDGKLRLARTPKFTWEENRIEQDTEVSVLPDGSSECRRLATYHGAAALNRRDLWCETPPGERRRLVTAELQDAHARTRLINLEIDERRLDDYEKPVQAKMDYRLTGHFTGEDVLEGNVTDSQVFKRIISFHLDPERSLPLELGKPVESIHRYHLRVPLGFRFEEAPVDAEVQSKWGFFKLRALEHPGEPRKLLIRFHLRLENTRVDPADFPAFQKFHEEIQKVWRGWMTLAKSEDLGDAPALEVLLAIAGPDVERTLALARLYLQNDEPGKAALVLARARAITPERSELWELSVQAAAGPKELESLYKDMVKRFPDEPKFALALAGLRIDLGDIKNARKVLEALTSHKEAWVSGESQYQLARCSLVEKKPKAAVKYLEAALKIDAELLKDGTAYELLGQAQESLGNKKEAADAFRKALGLDAKQGSALASLVRLEQAAGRGATTLPLLRRFTVTAEDDPQRLLLAADLYRILGRLEDAMELAEKAGEIGDEDKQVRRVLGLIYLERGDPEKALSYLEKAVEDEAVLLGRVQGYLALGRVNEADKFVRALERRGNAPPGLEKLRTLVRPVLTQRDSWIKGLGTPPTPEIVRAAELAALAQQAWRAGKPLAEVEKFLNAALEQDANFGPAFGLRGQLWLDRARLDKALADAEKALSLISGDPQSFLVRGRVRLERADPRALGDLAAAANLSKSDPWVLHWYAAALAKANRIDEAVARQREAVRLLPNNADLAEQLRDLERAAKE